MRLHEKTNHEFVSSDCARPPGRTWQSVILYGSAAAEIFIPNSPT